MHISSYSHLVARVRLAPARHEEEQEAQRVDVACAARAVIQPNILCHTVL